MLITPKLANPKARKNWRRLLQDHQLAKVGWAGAIGITVGIVAAILSAHRPAVAQDFAVSPAPFIVPVKASSPEFTVAQEQAQMTDEQADPQSIARLKTRNRRLEALVMVLRQRAAERR